MHEGVPFENAALNDIAGESRRLFEKFEMSYKLTDSVNGRRSKIAIFIFKCSFEIKTHWATNMTS